MMCKIDFRTYTISKNTQSISKFRSMDLQNKTSFMKLWKNQIATTSVSPLLVMSKLKVKLDHNLQLKFQDNPCQRFLFLMIQKKKSHWNSQAHLTQSKLAQLWSQAILLVQSALD